MSSYLTSREKLKAGSQWLVPNGIYWLTVAFGVVLGMSWAFHLFAFLTWIIIIIAIFGNIAVHLPVSETRKLRLAIRKRWINVVVDIVCDSIVAVIVIAFGHWFYGTLIILQIFAYQELFRQARKTPISTPMPS